jgi:hypothetical protein
MLIHCCLWAYVGPETVFPVASFLAGAAGIILITGKRLLRFGRRCWQRGTQTLAGGRGLEQR